MAGVKGSNSFYHDAILNILSSAYNFLSTPLQIASEFGERIALLQ